MTNGRKLRLIGTSGMACWGERCWPLRKSASKNTRECTTEGALPWPVMSFVILYASGTAGPERDFGPHESLSEKALNLIMDSQGRLRWKAIYTIISVTWEMPLYVWIQTLLNKPVFTYLLNGETITKSGVLTLRSKRPFTSRNSTQLQILGWKALF